MADGKTHSLVTIGASGGILGGAIASLFLTPEQMLAGVIGASFTLIYGNDADVDQGFIGDSFIRGTFGTDIFYDFWLNPYRRAYKHRGFWSHFPIISTLNRIIYLLFPPVILINKDQPTGRLELIFKLPFAMLVTGVLWTIIYLLWNINFPLLYWSQGLIFGMIVSDSLHWLFDRNL